MPRRVATREFPHSLAPAAAAERQHILPATQTASHRASKRPANAQVLRANKESILTVIEVFIHDPLYKWALTTTAANRRQHDGGAADEVRAWLGAGGCCCCGL